MKLVLVEETALNTPLPLLPLVSFWIFWWMTPLVITRVILERMCPPERIVVVRENRIYYPVSFRGAR